MDIREELLLTFDLFYRYFSFCEDLRARGERRYASSAIRCYSCFELMSLTETMVKRIIGSGFNEYLGRAQPIFPKLNSISLGGKSE